MTYEINEGTPCNITREDYNYVNDWLEANKGNERARNLKRLANTIRKRLDKDKDAVVCIDGVVGAGKSTLSVALSYLINNRFDIGKQFIFSPNTQNVIGIAQDSKSHDVIVMDEGIKCLYKLNWMTNNQKKLNIYYNVNRFENKVTIINIPGFNDLNLQFRKQRVSFRVYVYSRGKAAVFMKPRAMNAEDPWDVYSAEQKRKRWFSNNPAIGNSIWEKYIEDCAGFYFFIDFPDVSPKIKEWMYARKSETQNEGIADEPNVWKDRCVKLLYVLHHGLKMKQEDIGSLIGASQQGVGEWISVAALEPQTSESLQRFNDIAYGKLKLNSLSTEYSNCGKT